MKHGTVADTIAYSWVRSIKDGLHFFGREVLDKPGIGFLCRDRQNAMDLLQGRRHTMLHIVHKRLDGRQPNVSGPGPIPTFCFQMI